MEKIFTTPIYTNIKCSKCGKEYQTKKVLLNGKYMEITKGICHKCFVQITPKEQSLENDVKKLRRKLWLEVILPTRFHNASFENLQLRGNLKKVINGCKEYADKFPLNYSKIIDGGKDYPSFILCGHYGVGKTHIACSIIRRIIERWNGENITCPIMFISEGDIYRDIQTTYHYSNAEKTEKECEEDIIRKLVYIPLLVIDDIGKEQRQDTRFVQRILFSIIDSRYKLSKPVIVTTNLSGDELDSYLGGGTESASYDRLFEMCKGNIWLIEATSYRKQNG